MVERRAGNSLRVVIIIIRLHLGFDIQGKIDHVKTVNINTPFQPIDREPRNDIVIQVIIYDIINYIDLC